MEHPVIRWQVISPDPEASTRFMAGLFGWRANANNPLGYRELRAGDGGIHGGVWPAPPDVKPFVQLFVQVPDVDACLAQAEKLGAKVIVPKSVLPDGTQMAVMLDPLGMPIAICTG